MSYNHRQQVQVQAISLKLMSTPFPSTTYVLEEMPASNNIETLLAAPTALAQNVCDVQRLLEKSCQVLENADNVNFINFTERLVLVGDLHGLEWSSRS
jgi:hypothetical protein